MTTISEKRANETEDVYYKANVVLVDIEGTTTSIDFVKNTLFPYVRKNLELYLKSKWNDDEFKEDLKLLQEQSKQDEADGIEGLVKIPEGFSEDICEDVKKNVLWQMDLDRKTKALKQLQGHIWRDAYNKGEVKAHVYPDVAPALKSWKQNGKDIYVYSSGSVEAQKLLFGHTQDGNLLELFSGYFDTTVGPKVEESSYSNIVKSVKCKSEEILFFTDVPKEARAAKSAGLQAVIVVREGNLPITDDDKLEFPVIKSFDDIVFETSVKRRKKSEEEPLEQGKTSSAIVEVSSVEDVEMQEEPIAVKTETSKVTEGVSSTEMVEAVNKQPTPAELCATSEETKQPSCKEGTVIEELASTKQTSSELVSDKKAAEVTEQNETSSKTLEVNGAENLDAGSDASRTESNGPKCPKDNSPESNNIDNLPVTADVVPDAKTDKTKVNDKTEICEHDSKSCDDSPISTDKASKKPDTADSRANVDSLTEKTESSRDTTELPNKTECTYSEKTENVSAKTECTIADNSESTVISKTECVKPVDGESATKTESEVNKAEPMETDLTSNDLKNKAEPIHKDTTEVTLAVNKTDVSPVTDEKVAVTSSENEVPAVSVDSKTKSADSGKSVAVGEATPDSGKVAAETSSGGSKIEAAVEATPDADKVEAATEATPSSGQDAVETTTDAAKIEAATEATPDAAKVEAATPSSGQDAVETTPDTGKVEAATEATPDTGKVEAATEATPDTGKVEAATEATPDTGKVEAATEATPDTGKVEAVTEATPDTGKVEAATEATPDTGKVEAATEATPDTGKVEANVEVDMVEAPVEATPDGGKVEAAAEATPDGGEVEAAAEATPDGGEVEAAAEATPDGDKVDASVSAVKSDVTSESDASVAEVKVNETDVSMEDAEPMATDTVEQTATNKDNSKVKEECEPMVTDDSETMTTEEKTSTEGTNDAEPMVTDAEPMDTSKDETVNNTKNKADSEKLKTVQPGKERETKDESNECTKNVPSDSDHVNDNTNSNSAKIDVSVKDSNDSTKIGKTDTAAAAAALEKDALNIETKSSNTENKKSKPEDQNVVDNVKEVENDVGKNGVNSCVENGESKEKTDTTNEKLKIAAESADKVVENVVST